MTDEIKQLQAEFDAADEAMRGEVPPAAGEPDAAPGTGPGAEPEPMNRSEDIQTALVMAVNVLAPMFPSLKKVYTDEVVKSVGDATVPLANKYNVNVLGWFAKYQEEIVFAGVMIPVAMSTYGAVLHDLNGKEQDKSEGKGETTAGDASPSRPPRRKVHKLELREDDQ